MKIQNIAIAALGLLLLAPARAHAAPVQSVTTTFGSDNVISFWTNGPGETFAGVSGLPPGWGYFTNATNTFGQIQTGFGSGTFTFQINYTGSGLLPFTMDIQEVVYDPTAGPLFGTKQGLTFNPASNTFNPSAYGASGGPSGLQGPVPEPGSLLVLGLGLAGYAWKRRRSARVPAA